VPPLDHAPELAAEPALGHCPMQEAKQAEREAEDGLR
jgi:hypothetical protein